MINPNLLTDKLAEGEYKMKEKELEKLVGKENFQSLDKESRDFLIKVVGVIDFGVPIDIKKTLKYSIYDD